MSRTTCVDRSNRGSPLNPPVSVACWLSTSLPDQSTCPTYFGNHFEEKHKAFLLSSDLLISAHQQSEQYILIKVQYWKHDHSGDCIPGLEIVVLDIISPSKRNCEASPAISFLFSSEISGEIFTNRGGRPPFSQPIPSIVLRTCLMMFRKLPSCCSPLRPYIVHDNIDSTQFGSSNAHKALKALFPELN